jgi:hypothetical protein
MRNLKILWATKVTMSSRLKTHKHQGVTVQNLVARVTWPPRFVHPCIKLHFLQPQCFHLYLWQQRCTILKTHHRTENLKKIECKFPSICKLKTRLVYSFTLRPLCRWLKSQLYPMNEVMKAPVVVWLPCRQSLLLLRIESQYSRP